MLDNVSRNSSVYEDTVETIFLESDIRILRMLSTKDIVVAGRTFLVATEKLVAKDVVVITIEAIKEGSTVPVTKVHLV